ncbi:MAG: plasmid replication, integration and excision activator [Dermatophilaceae bacterium]
MSPLADFDASTKDNRVQARDKDSGLPVWVVDVMDFDPEARERVLKVKISAPVQPVPPESIPGTPVRPVVLEGLTVTPYVKDGPRPRIAYSLRDTALTPAPPIAGDDGKAA